MKKKGWGAIKRMAENSAVKSEMAAATRETPSSWEQRSRGQVAGSTTARGESGGVKSEHRTQRTCSTVHSRPLVHGKIVSSATAGLSRPRQMQKNKQGTGRTRRPAHASRGGKGDNQQSRATGDGGLRRVARALQPQHPPPHPKVRAKQQAHTPRGDPKVAAHSRGAGPAHNPSHLHPPPLLQRRMSTVMGSPTMLHHQRSLRMRRRRAPHRRAWRRPGDPLSSTGAGSASTRRRDSGSDVAVQSISTFVPP